MNTLVKDWMTSEVITVTSSSTLPEAYWLMIKNGIRQLPVVDKNNTVGIVALSDLQNMDPVSIVGFDVIRISDRLAKLPVHNIMTRDVQTVAPEATLIDAARLLLEHKISALPVIDEGRLVGIITESDIFRAFVELLESMENSAG